MPYGTTWPRVLTFFTSAMLSMLAGAQLVHVYYRPLDDLEEYVLEEMQTIKK